MSLGLKRFFILGGVATLLAACDPNVVIGAKWRVEEGGVGAQAGTGVAASSGSGGGGVAGAGAGGGGGTEQVVGGAAGAGEGGAPSAGAGGAPDEPDEWCATAPWLNMPVQFTGDADAAIPAGNYVIRYVSGALIHDPDIGYEVTDWYYGKNSLHAGHHVFSGDSPETGATSLWLDENGIVGSGGSIAEVEAANRGHTWPLEHAGGELFVTLYDDDYGDNVGPGSRFCISAAQ